MFEISELIVSTRRVIFTGTWTEVYAKLAEMGVAHLEDDADYPDCADALLLDGRVVAIQPVGFKVAS